MAESQAGPAGMSEGARLAGIFWEPKPVFQDLAERPRFWVPLLLLTVLSVAYIVSFSQRAGWEGLFRRQFESNSRVQQLSPEQREQALAQSMKFAVPMAYASAVLGVPIATLVVAAILLGIFNLAGGANLKFAQAFSITCYSFMPSALATILAMVVLFLKDPADFDLQNPLPLSLGAFLGPQDAAAWIRSVANSFSLFTIWLILLLALGLSTAARRMTFAKGLALVGVPWGIWVLLRAALAGVTGG